MSTKESPAFTWQQILEDVPAPKGGYGLPNQSPNLAPGLIPPQPLHSRPEESDFTGTESRTLPGGCGKGRLTRTGFVWESESVLQTQAGDACATL